MSGAIRIKTYYGLQVLATKDLDTAIMLTRDEGRSLSLYDRNILDMQKANCGWYIINELQADPVDSEYDLGVIYEMLKNQKI